MSDKKYYHTLDEYAYFGNDLGAVYSKEKTVFKVWAPSASAVELKIYATGDSSVCTSSHSMTMLENGVWSITLDGDRKNTYYTYLVTVGGALIRQAGKMINIYSATPPQMRLSGKFM